MKDNSWSIYTLRDITTKLGDGLHGTPVYDDNGEYHFINGSNLSNGKIIIKDDTKSVAKSEYDKYKKDLNDRTILVSINGTLGNIAYYNNEKVVLGKSACYFNVKDYFCKSYIRYVMSTSMFKAYLENYATGATIKNVSLEAMRNFKFSAPEECYRQKIASVLSAYDDLIEKNNRKIQILQDMAEELYKEWFVRFRFPGYKTTNFIDGIPEGWEVKQLGNIATVIMGQSPASEFYNTNNEGLPFHQGVGSYGKLFLRDTVYSTEGNRIAEPNSIIFSVRAPVGRINRNLSRIILGRGVAAINSTENYNEFLLYSLKNLFQMEDIIGGGTIFTSATRNDVESIKVLYPTQDIIEAFNSIAKNIEEQLRLLYLTSCNLTTQRDLLLPRLMSGKLKVKIS